MFTGISSVAVTDWPMATGASLIAWIFRVTFTALLSATPSLALKTKESGP